MTKNGTVVVAGLGEVGKPLLALLSETYQTLGLDLDPVEPPEHTTVLHVCYPYEIPDFIGVTARYIDSLKPDLTVINSTVGIGTTRAVAERTGTPVVNSPIRGKHARMLDEIRMYTKFVGAIDAAAGEAAAEHFAGAGLKTKVLTTPEASELAKLTETTYFGVMIAWAQEVERYCDHWGASYEEVVAFYDEIKFFPPVKYFPGVIGGHCVMPNIEILGKTDDSLLLQAVRESNKAKVERETSVHVRAVA